MGKASRAKAVRQGAPGPGKKSGSPAGKKSVATTLAQKLTTWQATLGLFVFLFALFAVTADYSGAERPNDVHWSAIVGWSIAKLGSLDMEKFQLTLLNVRTWLFNVGPLESGSCYSGNAVMLPGSHCRSDRFPGSILLSVPFYFVFGTTKIFAIAPATLSAVTASAGALTFLYRAMLRIVTPAVALGSVFLMAFTTGIWTVAANLPWTHAAVLLGLGIGVWGMSSQRYATAGLGYAFAILSRPHTAIVPFGVGVWESIQKRSVIPALKVGLLSSVGIAGLLIYNRINAGQWTLLSGSYEYRPDAVITAPGAGAGAGSGTKWISELRGALISPFRGWFVLSPYLLLLLPGVVRAWKVAPSWVRGSAIGGMGYFFFQLAGNNFAGGLGYFGYRVTIEPLFALVPLLALCFVTWTAQARWRLITFTALASAALWWFAWGAMFYRLPVGAGFDVWKFDFVQPFADGKFGQLFLAGLLAAGLMSVLVYVWRSSAEPAARIESTVDA